IPSYNLVRCAKENPELQKYVTSLSFWESLSCMFHKLWDEQQERMITFKEYYQLEARVPLQAQQQRVRS
ncbi:MAG: fatty acid desaturase, partial [Bacteroidetes bacterium]